MNIIKNKFLLEDKIILETNFEINIFKIIEENEFILSLKYLINNEMIKYVIDYFKSNKINYFNYEKDLDLLIQNKNNLLTNSFYDTNLPLINFKFNHKRKIITIMYFKNFDNSLSYSLAINYIISKFKTKYSIEIKCININKNII